MSVGGRLPQLDRAINATGGEMAALVGRTQALVAARRAAFASDRQRAQVCNRAQVADGAKLMLLHMY
jgi:hypothetical protein